MNGPGVDSPLVDEVFSDAGDAADAGLFWAVTDHAGSVRDVLGGSSHDIVNHIEYDAYGDILLAIDPFKEEIGNGNPRAQYKELAVDAAFAGRDWDDDADLYYNRARWYDASNSRFISQDPIGFAGGDINLYRYAGGDPVNFSDPSGLFFKKLWRETKRIINDVVDFVEDSGDYVEEKYKGTVRALEYIARNPEDAFKSAIKDPVFWAGLAFGPIFSASFSYGFFNVNLGLNGLSTGIDFLGFGKQALSVATGGGFNIGLPSVNIASPIFNYAGSIDVGAFATSSSGSSSFDVTQASHNDENLGLISRGGQDPNSLGALRREYGYHQESGGGDTLRQITGTTVETGLALMPGSIAVEAINLAGGQDFAGRPATLWDYAAAPFTAIGAGIGYVGNKASGLFFRNADSGVDLARASRLVPGGGLAAHERAGGHLIARHVGIVDTDLAKRLVAQPRIRGASSFTSRAIAETAVSAGIDANTTLINKWLVGSKPSRLALSHTANDVVGRVYLRGSASAVDSQSLKIILQRDPSFSEGYRVLTGFPTP